MKTKSKQYIYNHRFTLEKEAGLPAFELTYTTVGELNENRDNVIWICHAMTGSSDFNQWWHGLIGEGKTIDPKKYFVVCANFLGSCYGSTGPMSENPTTGAKYFHDFPVLTIRDIVRSFELLKEYLNIASIEAIIGGSLGGQQVLQWAIMYPNSMKKIIPIACNAKHSAWGIAFNEVQRMAIENDKSWFSFTPGAGIDGLKTARSIAVLSYRHYDIFKETQTDEDDEIITDYFQSQSYLRYQGFKIAKRFNAYSYHLITRMMDLHNVGQGFKGGVREALSTIKAKTLVIGIETDILFPFEEQEFMAEYIPDATLKVLRSKYGHDGFLKEVSTLNEYFKEIVQ